MEAGRKSGRRDGITGLALGALLIFAGCGGSNATSTASTAEAPNTTAAKVVTTSSTVAATTTSTTTVPMGVADALPYFEALGRQTEADFALMASLAAPGSVAAMYAYHQERVYLARKQDCDCGKPSFATISGDAIDYCEKSDCANLLNHFADFEFVDGRLSSFTSVGRDMSTTLKTWPDDGETECWSPSGGSCGGPASIDVTARSAYRAFGGTQWFTFDLVRGSGVAGSVTWISGAIDIDGKSFPISHEGNYMAPLDTGVSRVWAFELKDAPVGHATITMNFDLDGRPFGFEFDLGDV